MLLAVISDLHIGDKARSPDLRPGVVGLSKPRYLDQFAVLARTLRSPDYLVVPGDIANTACPNEYFHAVAVIEEVAAHLKVAREAILFVPGNHDISWRLQKLGDVTPSAQRTLGQAEVKGQEFWRSKKFLPISEVLARALNAPVSSGELFSKPYLVHHDFPDAIILRVNSAYGCDFDNMPSHGRIDGDTIVAMRAALSGKKASVDKRPVIAVLHHHILPTDEPDPYWTDLSAAQGAEAFINALMELGVDFVIHGHKHWPRFRVHSSPSDGLFAVLGAGSFSAQIDAQVQGKVFNTFHMIEFSGRDAAGNLSGWIDTWCYQGAPGWAVYKDGVLPGRQPFGNYRTRQQLHAEISAAIKHMVTGTAKVRVVDLLASLPNFEFIEGKRFRDALLSEARSAGLRVTMDVLSETEFVHR